MTAPKLSEEEREQMLDHMDFETEDQCPNCGGEGVVYCCFEEFACIDPESGCEYCERRCDWCRPAAKR